MPMIGNVQNHLKMVKKNLCWDNMYGNTMQLLVSEYVWFCKELVGYSTFLRLCSHQFFFRGHAEPQRNIISSQSSKCSHLDFFQRWKLYSHWRTSRMSHIKGAVQITFDPSRHVHEARMSFCRASIAVEYRQSPWSGLACALIACDRNGCTQQ